MAWAQSGDSVLTGNCVGTVVTSGGTTVVGSSCEIDEERGSLLVANSFFFLLFSEWE